MNKLWAAFALFLVVFGVLLWGSDQVTWEGERTIYAVNCEGGTWSGLRCTGRLAAGDRFRFRASRARNEVFYWVAGSKSPSGKHSDCQVRNRDNWACKPQAGQPPSIAIELSHGRPKAGVGAPVVPFHAVTKWKWLALDLGLSWFDAADYSNESPPLPQ